MARIFTCDAVMCSKLLHTDPAQLARAGLTVMDIVYVPGLWAGTAKASQALYMEDVNEARSDARGGTLGIIYDTQTELPQSLREEGFTGTSGFYCQSICDTGVIGAGFYYAAALLPSTQLPLYNLSDGQAGYTAFYGAQAGAVKRVHYPVTPSTRSSHGFDRARISSTGEAVDRFGSVGRAMVAALCASGFRENKRAVLTHSHYNDSLPSPLQGTV